MADLGVLQVVVPEFGDMMYLLPEDPAHRFTVGEHCQSMPAAYLLNTPPEELAAHIGYVRVVRKGSPVVDLRDDRAGEFTVLTVVTTDRTGLLSDIAGVMHALGIDIHAAQIFTRSSTDQIAIDTIYIDFEGRQLTEMKKWQVQGGLLSSRNHETGENTEGTLIAKSRNRRKPERRFPGLCLPGFRCFRAFAIAPFRVFPSFVLS